MEIILPDQIKLYFDKAGAGSPPFVFTRSWLSATQSAQVTFPRWKYPSRSTV
ncbi:MAG: hypothetical protein JO299_03200 [Gammaproteobacteria bacterium]|nr:hypothetical protein [Gammaproteobacteria bacterium]